jgi:beta-xylosidase
MSLKLKDIRVSVLFNLIIGVLFIVGCTDKAKYRSGSWGDQGDGTYTNPVLNADYPDVDIEAYDGKYYMIASSQQMVPGMPILESSDLVNWKIIGHVYGKLTWSDEYNWDQMNGYHYGVWAGDLVRHENKWLCYMIDFNHGLLVSSADTITGPWSKPVKILSTKTVFDDPAVFWDYQENQAYLMCNTGQKLMQHKTNDRTWENRVFEMDWSGTKVLDSGKVIYRGPMAEAAKIYKIKGVWYIFISEWYRPDPNADEFAEGAPDDRKQIVLRSTTNSIYGPYEKKIVLERGNSFARSCSQGALVQAPDSSWWYYHQLIQNSNSPFQGRPQCLQPVEWIDGWPIIGNDIDDDGIGEPVLMHKKPVTGYPVRAPATSDDFSSNHLGLQWEWNHNPRDTHWSLSERSGWLRLKAMKPVEFQKDSYEKRMTPGTTMIPHDFWLTPNVISQRIMGTTTGTAVAKLDISGMANGQYAGFVRFGGVFYIMGVKQKENEERMLVFIDAHGNELEGPEINEPVLFIKTSNLSDQAKFAYSLDGLHYTDFGTGFTLKFGNWKGDRLGFFTWNSASEEGIVDIDYFNYEYDGPLESAKSVVSDNK